MVMIQTIKMKLMIILISNLYYPNKIFDMNDVGYYLQLLTTYCS